MTAHKKEVICLMKSVVTCYIGHLCPVVGHISLLSNVFKIVFGLSHLDFQEFFEFAKVKSTRANHSYKLSCKLSRLNCLKYPFFNNVISHWNDLPRNVVEAGSRDLFKCRLNSFLKL